MKKIIRDRQSNIILDTPNGKLSNGGTCITKTSSGIWNCNTRGVVGFFEGIHGWIVRLETGLSLSVGICRSEIHLTDCAENDDKRIDVYCGSGEVVTGDNIVIAEPFLLRTLKSGSEITFILDLIHQQLRVAVDGKWISEPIVTELEKGMWYPYLCLERKGTSVSLHYI